MPAAGEIRRRVSSPANIIPIPSGVMGAPSSPWITRAATSQEADPASAQVTHASVNPATLATYTCLAAHRLVSEALAANPDANPSRRPPAANAGGTAVRRAAAGRGHARERPDDAASLDAGRAVRSRAAVAERPQPRARAQPQHGVGHR